MNDITEDDLQAAFAALGARRQEELNARLAELATEFEVRLESAADPDQRAAVLAWLRQPSPIPPHMPPPTGDVTLRQVDDWLTHELARAIAQADAMMKAAAERALTHDCIGGPHPTAH